MPDQIKRLLIAFAAIMALFFLARVLLVPKSFGEYGHYRGDALAENANKPLKFAGQAACAECHDDIVALRDSSVHVSLSCEGCHGPALQHTLEPDTAQLLKPVERTDCARCHALNAARSVANVKQIDINEHNTESKCIECHNPHDPWN